MTVNYTKTNWKNDGGPYLNEKNLNNIEKGVKDCANEINAHESELGKHREINDKGSSATDLWSALKIGLELAARSVPPVVGEENILADISVTPDSPAGTEHSWVIKVGGIGVVKIYGESDGEGSVRNLKVQLLNYSSFVLPDEKGNMHTYTADTDGSLIVT